MPLNLDPSREITIVREFYSLDYQFNITLSFNFSGHQLQPLPQQLQPPLQQLQPPPLQRKIPNIMMF